MKSKLDRTLYPAPLVFNLFKPAGPSSGTVLTELKRKLPRGFGKIGHFGTLDPFACGVFLVGLAGASRLNDLIHSAYPKTYLAVGKLGIKSLSGDCTHPDKTEDTSEYPSQVISKFDLNFLNQRLQEKFVGDYWQSPPAFSAAKFEGRALHEWAREGITIAKEKVQRHIFSLEVVKFSYPFLSIRVTASSGTYIRTLFEDIAHDLGTYGMLIALVREQIGPFHFKESLSSKMINAESGQSLLSFGTPIDQAFRFARVECNPEQAYTKFQKGGDVVLAAPLTQTLGPYAWAISPEGRVLGLGKISEMRLRPFIVFENS